MLADSCCNGIRRAEFAEADGVTSRYWLKASTAETMSPKDLSLMAGVNLMSSIIRQYQASALLSPSVAVTSCKQIVAIVECKLVYQVAR